MPSKFKRINLTVPPEVYNALCLYQKAYGLDNDAGTALCHASVNIFQKRLDRIRVIGLTVVFIKIICVDGCCSLSNSSQVLAFLPRPLQSFWQA